MRENQRLYLILPLATYALLMWRSVYGQLNLWIRVLDLVLVAVGLGTWVILQLGRRAPWPSTDLDRPLLAWLAAAALTTLTSVNLRGSLYGLWDYVIGMLLLGVLVTAVQRGWSAILWRTLYTIAAVVLLMGVIELLAWYFGWTLVPIFQQGWFSIGGISEPIPPTLRRLCLPLVNATTLSAFVALLIPPALCLMLGSRNHKTRWGLLVWLVLAGAILLLSQSRGGFLALAASLPFLVWGGAHDPGFRRWWSQLSYGTSRALLVLAVTGALVLTVGVGLLITIRLRPSSHNIDDRLDLWRSGAAMFLDHPLTGVGPTAFGTALRDYRNPLLARDQYNATHNLYLEVAAEMGAPGLLAGAWLAFALVRAWWRRWQAEEPGAAAWWRVLGIGAALAGLAAQSMVDTFDESAVMLPVGLFVAQILVPMGRIARPAAWQRWTAAIVALAVGATGVAWDHTGAAHFDRSVALAQRGEVDGGLEAVEQARRIDPWTPLYACHAGYLHGLRAANGITDAQTAAIAAYGECTSAVTVPGWADALNLAALLHQSGEIAEARALIADATVHSPLHWELWLNRGMWAEEAGARNEAIQAYGRVLVLDPDLAGSPFWRQGERAAWWDEIVTAGEQFIDTTGDTSPYWRWQVTGLLGRWTEIEHEIETWLAADPNDANALTWLAESLLAQGQARAAYDRATRALALDSTQIRSYLVRGEARLALSEVAAAERDFRIALFIRPTSRAHLGVARSLLAAGDIDGAQHQYRLALRQPTAPHTYNLVLYHRAGWPQRLPQILHIGYQTDEQVALEWGVLLEETGDAELAQRVYAAALRIDPFMNQVRARLER